jgi:hypothetical protein
MFEKIPFTKMQVNGTKVGAVPSCINNNVITRHLIIERESYVSARVAAAALIFLHLVYVWLCTGPSRSSKNTRALPFS